MPMLFSLLPPGVRIWSRCLARRQEATPEAAGRRGTRRRTPWLQVVQRMPAHLFVKTRTKREGSRFWRIKKRVLSRLPSSRPVCWCFPNTRWRIRLKAAVCFASSCLGGKYRVSLPPLRCSLLVVAYSALPTVCFACCVVSKVSAQ